MNDGTYWQRVSLLQMGPLTSSVIYSLSPVNTPASSAIHIHWQCCQQLAITITGGQDECAARREMATTMSVPVTLDEHWSAHYCTAYTLAHVCYF